MNKSSMSNPSVAEQGGKKDAVVDQAKQAMSNVAGQAREQVGTQLGARKEKAVAAMESVAKAIRNIDELEGVGPLGDVAERAADGIESAAHFFERKQIGDLVRDAERFARREPALFLGAATAIGLIAGRFLKSSAPSRQGGSEGTGPRGWVDADSEELMYGSSYGEGGYEDGFLSGTDLAEEEEVATAGAKGQTPSSSSGTSGSPTLSGIGKSPGGDGGTEGSR